MSYRIALAGMIALMMGLCGRPASAQLPVQLLVTFDEYGHGTAVAGPITGTIPATIGADPGPGGLSHALIYDAGSTTFVPGDVVLLEPSATPVISDIIRFNMADATTGTPATVVFYSDNSDGVDSPADTGFPTTVYGNVVIIEEIGLEGTLNGAIYHPTSTQPGFSAVADITYIFISDVPEPGTLAYLGGLAIPGLAFLRLRRRA